MKLLFYPIDDAKKAAALPGLFAILYDNMNPIAPMSEAYEDGCHAWCDTIAHALEDDRRTLLVVYDEEVADTVGFFMYAVNRETGLFLMEEIQLKKSYQGKGIFHRIYDAVLPSLPSEVTTVEAYALKNNMHSQGILTHFGLAVIGENKSGNCHHFRGKFAEFRRRMNRDSENRP